MKFIAAQFSRELYNSIIQKPVRLVNWKCYKQDGQEIISSFSNDQQIAITLEDD